MTTVPTFIVGHMSGRELGSALAGRPRPVRRRLDGRTAGLVRRRDDAPVRAAPGRGRLAGLQRDADLRRRPGGAPGRGRMGPDHQGRGARSRRAASRSPSAMAPGVSRSPAGRTGSGSPTPHGCATSSARTSYPVGDDPIRQRYAAAWACELASTFGRPVVLEEFGVSSDFASEPNAARYYRHVLHHSLLAGATGWIAWNNTDFDLPGQDPYRHHAFEQHFGLTDATGQPKATLREMRAFVDTLDAIEFGRLRPDRQRHRPDRPVLPGHRLPVHRPGRPRADRAVAGPGLRLGPAGRPGARADQGNRRHQRAALGCTWRPR